MTMAARIGGGYPAVARVGPLTCAGVSSPALEFLDDDDERLAFDADEADALFSLTGDLDAATVSACPGCRSRVVAVVALVDLIEDAPPVPHAEELVELADEAPTLHLYVRDLATTCRHRAWLDPGAEEWAEAVGGRGRLPALNGPGPAVEETRRPAEAAQ